MSNTELSWNRGDIERKLGFPAKKYTGINSFFSFLCASFLTIIFYAILYPVKINSKSALVDMFFHGGPENRSIIPYVIVFFSAWSLAILLLKRSKLKLQKKALNIAIVPEDVDFHLSPATASKILEKVYLQVDEPRKFMLLNRIERSLANLKNLGQVADVAEGLGSQAENDEVYLDSTYTIIKGFIWAIPVMGFIGTVLGLSQAVGGFGSVLSSQEADMSQMKEALTGVTGGLATAFETTLIALVFALFIQIILTFVRKREEDFFDECSDYCHRNIISRLRMIKVNED